MYQLGKLMIYFLFPIPKTITVLTARCEGHVWFSNTKQAAAAPNKTRPINSIKEKT